MTDGAAGADGAERLSFSVGQLSESLARFNCAVSVVARMFSSHSIHTLECQAGIGPPWSASTLIGPLNFDRQPATERQSTRYRPTK